MFHAAMGQGRHAFRYAGEDEPGYFGLALSQRNVIAVTGACLLTRRETYDALGGFDEAHGVINNTLHFRLRAWQSGLVNLYTPHAKLIHHEAVSRAGMADDYDAAVFDSRWRNLFLAGDPFFNPNLTRNRDDFSIDAEPNQLLFAGRPAISRDQIRRILIVKLDHIGDCIVAFPAVRRLTQHFPEACFTVLTSRASRAVWSTRSSNSISSMPARKWACSSVPKKTGKICAPGSPPAYSIWRSICASIWRRVSSCNIPARVIWPD